MNFKYMLFTLKSISFITELKHLLFWSSHLDELNPPPTIDFPLFDILVVCHLKSGLFKALILSSCIICFDHLLRTSLNWILSSKWYYVLLEIFKGNFRNAIFFILRKNLIIIEFLCSRANKSYASNLSSTIKWWGWPCLKGIILFVFLELVSAKLL